MDERVEQYGVLSDQYDNDENLLAATIDDELADMSSQGYNSERFDPLLLQANVPHSTRDEDDINAMLEADGLGGMLNSVRNASSPRYDDNKESIYLNKIQELEQQMLTMEGKLRESQNINTELADKIQQLEFDKDM